MSVLPVVRMLPGEQAEHGVTHTTSVKGPCPAGKQGVSAHLLSATSWTGRAGVIAVVRGRCVFGGERAATKDELGDDPGAATLTEYLKLYSNSAAAAVPSARRENRLPRPL